MKQVRSIAGISYNKLFYNRYRKFFVENDKRLKHLEGLYAGERCFVIATGPSIKKTNLNLLKDEYTFAVNEFFSYKKSISTTFYVVVTKEISRYYENLCKLDSVLFMGGNAGRWYLSNQSSLNIFPKSEKPVILKDYGEIDVWDGITDDLVRNGVRGGKTVMFETLQLAGFMGFKEVYLLGVDCTYKKEHHCYPGRRWEGDERPWDEIFHRYEIVKRDLEKIGCKVFNATVGGNLDVFDRVELSDVI